MKSERSTHAGVNRRIPMPGGGYTEISLNLSGIQPTDSAEMIATMMGQATLAISLMFNEIEHRVAELAGGPRLALDPTPSGNLGALFGEHPVSEPVANEPPKSELAQQLEASIALVQAQKAEEARKTEEAPFPPQGDEYDPFAEDAPPIPPPGDVTTGGVVFGNLIDFPPAEWHLQQLSDTDPATGEHGGQLKAINAALTSLGYGGAFRHYAALAILVEFGPIAGTPARQTVGSIRDLTKAEAHIILSFIEMAEKNPSSLAHFAAAVRRLKG